MPRDDETGAGVPKLCGADVELGNFILGVDDARGTAAEASRALLREIDAPWAHWYGATGPAADAQDWGRKFLPTNGGCVYVDLDHLEVCLPEVLSAWDHVAAWHAMLRIVRGALGRANARRPDGETIHVLANNSDGHGAASYGAHLNFLLARRTWDDLFERKVHPLLFLAAFQVSSIVYTGQGKVGAENGRPAVGFQLSQRADFFETLVGEQTTYRRPIVNARDEALCGRRSHRAAAASGPPPLARLHSIFFDSTLCHGSSLLKVGTMQIVLAMIEAGRVDPTLVLDDPVAAVGRWSHDPTLEARARLASGASLTAIELQLRFLEAAQRFVDDGGCDGVVPRAREIVGLWEDTLARLRSGDVAGLAGRIDWMLKFRIVHRALLQRPGLTWVSPEVKHLDHLYSSLDPDDGLYWLHERLGVTESLVPEAHVAALVDTPPDDTRAWTRATLLGLAGPDVVQDVDWDMLRFRITGPRWWPVTRTLTLDDPLGFTRATVEDVVRRAATLDDVLDALDAGPPILEPTPTLYDWSRVRPNGGDGPDTPPTH